MISEVNGYLGVIFGQWVMISEVNVEVNGEVNGYTAVEQYRHSRNVPLSGTSFPF